MTMGLNPVHSTSFGGVGTQTFTCTTGGTYTVQVTASLPWLTPDQPSFEIGAINQQTVTTVDDVSSSLNDTYFTFYDAGDVYGYYAWYNVDGAGTDPEVEGLTGIEVAIAEDDDAATVATATRDAINAVTNILVVASGEDADVILTNTGFGACTAAVDGDDATGFAFAVGTAGDFGSTSGLVIKVYNDDTLVLALSEPSSNQATMAGAITTPVAAGDDITVVISSLSDVDLVANAVKGVINVFQG